MELVDDGVTSNLDPHGEVTRGEKHAKHTLMQAELKCAKFGFKLHMYGGAGKNWPMGRERVFQQPMGAVLALPAFTGSTESRDGVT